MFVLLLLLILLLLFPGLHACVKANGQNTLTHAVTCDAVHSLNRHIVLTDSWFCQYLAGYLLRPLP